MGKTNAVRLLERQKIPYRLAEYEYDENDLNGMHAAEGIGMPPEQIFKTLVARDDKNRVLVFCVPVCGELDLKKAAAAAGSKSVRMIPVKELLSLTGYIRGGCSPIGMKKIYPTYIDESALQFDEIGVSAGARGCQLLLDPNALIAFVPMTPQKLTTD
ncbi:MAG: Cys-tRNA(Pro) deacylase [Oscillospiraceae bacterium]|nr:Cys-tRNA(Pro) deacylase [Oscillospiraceae bacterium]MBR2897833.1 Cys-tRNA(Pro) deacylase [Oscillospiraceae bacterium]